ncbi:MAG: autotransporter-associated beta strand repeat-containing protein [Verrucomicrobiota bacterium]
MKSRPFFFGRLLLPAAALFSFCGSASTSLAGNTWDGGGTTDNWSDDANWNADGQPAYGTYTFAGSTRTTTTVDQNYSTNQLLWTGTNAWTLNNSNSAVISLFDNGGVQAKVENQSTGLVTINAPITFANTNATNPWGEINAVSGGITFGTGTLTVTGSQVNGIRLFGGTAQTTTFNNTVSASGKYFNLIGPVISGKGTGTSMSIGGSFAAGEIYVGNGSTLNYTGGTITNDALTGIRLGGDFATTTFQDLTKSGTFNITPVGGGLTYTGVINSVASNTSGTLAVNSNNTSGTNILSGHIALDSALKITQAAGTGTLSITQARANSTDTLTGLDVKNQTLSLQAGTGGTISISGDIYNSSASTTGTINAASTGAVTMTGAINAANANGIIALANTSTGSLTLNGATTNFLSTLRATAGGSVTVNNAAANITVANSSSYGGNLFGSRFTLTAGTIAFNGGLTTSSNTSGDIGFIVNGGSFSAASIFMHRTTDAISTTGGATTSTAQNMTTKGFQVNGGTASVTGAVNLAGSNAAANGQVSGTGSLTIGGELTLGGTAGSGTTRTTLFQVTGGTLTVNDVTNGISLGKGTTTASSGELLLTGGTTTTEKITFGVASGLAGSFGNLTLNGGTLYIGTGGIVKAATNAYTSAINLYGGTLGAKGIWASDASLGMTLLGNITIQAADASNVARNIAINGGFTNSGSSSRILTVSGVGTTTVSNLYLSEAQGTGRLLTITGVGNLTLSNIADSAAGIATAGSSGLSFNSTFTGIATLSNANTYTGTTTVSSGNFVLGNKAAFGTSAVTLNGGSISANTDLSVASASAIGNTVSTTASGSTATFTGSNNIQLNGLVAANVSRTVTSNLDAGKTLTLSGGLSLASSTNNFTTTFNGTGAILINSIVSGGTSATAGSLTYTGSNTLTLAGANTYGGTTTIGSGSTVQVGNVGTTGTLGSSAVSNSGTLNFNRTDTGLTVSGAISGAGSVNQNGSGTTNLTGYSSSTGNFNINAGILAANAGNNSVNPTTSALGNTQNAGRSINVNNGGTLRFDAGDVLGGATSTVLTSLVINVDGIVTNTAGVFNTLGQVNLNGGTLTGNGGAVPGYQMYRFGGAVTVAGSVASTISGTGTNSGYHLGSNNTFDVADATANSAVDLTVSGLLINQTNSQSAAAGGFTKTGGGTMALSAANTYSGTTTISGGVVRLDNTNAVQNSTVSMGVADGVIFGTGIISATLGGLSGASNLALTSGGSAVVLSVGNNNANTTYSGQLSGTGSSLSKIGSGTTTLSNTNSYTGGTTITAGTLALNSLGANANSGHLSAGTVTMQNGATLALTGNGGSTDSLTVDNVIAVASGATATIFFGERSVLNGNNTGDSTTTLKLVSGTIDRNDIGGSWIGFNGTLVFNDTNSTVRDMELSNNGGTFNTNGLVNATVDIQEARLRFTANTGGNTVKLGALQGSASGILGGNSQGDGVTWEVGAKNLNTDFAGSIQNGNNSTIVTKVGTGTLTLSGSNTYTGATNIHGGTLSISGSSAIADTGAVIVANTSGAAFNLLANETIGSLEGGGATGGNVTLNSNQLLTGNDNTSTTYGGVMSGTDGSLEKLGTGTLTLTGSNTYTGATAVSHGKLIVGVFGGGGSITSNVTVASGATVGGSGTITGNVSLSGGGTLAAGNSPGVLTATGTTSFGSTSIFAWEIDTDTVTPGRGTEYDGLNTTAVSGSGAVFQIVTSDSEAFGDNFWSSDHTWSDIFKSPNGSTALTNDWSTVFSSFAYSNGSGAISAPVSGSFSWTNGGNTLNFSAVPEPTSALAGLLIAAGLLRRRRDC